MPANVLAEGMVSDQVIDTYGGNFTYQLQIGYEGIEPLFRQFEGRKIRIIVEDVEESIT